MDYSELINIDNFQITPLLIFALMWSLVWKGLSLWKAAKNDNKGWFVALLMVNTFGFLEIIYFFFLGKKRRVVIGGTFDSFHKGHKALLSKAFSLGNEIFIGLTSDEMAQETKKRKVENYNKRKRMLEKECSKFGKKVIIKKINNIYGFAINEDFDFIIVSSETKPNALAINKKRKERGLKELKIVEIDFIMAKDGKPISSTRIYNGEINREGEIKNNSKSNQ